jgi:hypothetical protein
MRKEVVKIIENQEYTFYAMPATQSLKTLIKISKLLCSTLGAGLDAGLATELKPIEQVKSILKDNLDLPKIFQELSRRLDEDEVLEAALLLFAQTSHKGSGRLNSQEVVDVHFGGKVRHMMKVFAAALKIEYADFFAEGQGLESIISQAKENLTPAP